MSMMHCDKCDRLVDTDFETGDDTNEGWLCDRCLEELTEDYEEGEKATRQELANDPAYQEWLTKTMKADLKHQMEHDNGHI